MDVWRSQQPKNDADGNDDGKIEKRQKKKNDVTRERPILILRSAFMFAYAWENVNGE